MITIKTVFLEIDQIATLFNAVFFQLYNCIVYKLYLNTVATYRLKRIFTACTGRKLTTNYQQTKILYFQSKITPSIQKFNPR